MKSKFVLALTMLVTLLPLQADALTQQRWEEIQQHDDDLVRQYSYRPKVGDICFAGKGDNVGWITTEAKARYSDLYLAEWKRLGSAETYPDDKFENMTVASSNGGLIKLDAGTKVKVLEGTCAPDKPGYSGPQNPGFSGGSGKIEILSGANAGKICYNGGMGLQDSYSVDTGEFCKTDEENLAQKALLYSKLSKTSLPDALALAGVIIDPSATSDDAALTKAIIAWDLVPYLGLTFEDVKNRSPHRQIEWADNADEHIVTDMNNIGNVKGFGEVREPFFSVNKHTGRVGSVGGFNTFDIAYGDQAAFFNNLVAEMEAEYGPALRISNHTVNIADFRSNPKYQLRMSVTALPRSNQVTVKLRFHCCHCQVLSS